MSINMPCHQSCQPATCPASQQTTANKVATTVAGALLFEGQVTALQNHRQPSNHSCLYPTAAPGRTQPGQNCMRVSHAPSPPGATLCLQAVALWARTANRPCNQRCLSPATAPGRMQPGHTCERASGEPTPPVTRRPGWSGDGTAVANSGPPFPSHGQVQWGGRTNDEQTSTARRSGLCAHQPRAGW